MSEEEKRSIETMKHWIDYEKANKDKINKANELIEIQETILNLLEKKDKIINKMSEQLTTPIHSKEWVIEYYTKEVEEKYNE